MQVPSFATQFRYIAPSESCETRETLAYHARELYRPSLALSALLPLKDSGMRPGYGVEEGRHKACPYRTGVGMPEAARGRREGRYKACT